MESFTRKLSSSKKSSREILTKKNVQTDVLKIENFVNKLHVAKVVKLTAARKELILVLQYLGQQSFEIRNRIQCYINKNSPVFNLKVVFQFKKNFPHYLLLKIKITKCFTLTQFKCLSVIYAMILIMIKPNAISKLEPVSIQISLP